MPTVKRLELTYDELNEYGTFSEGDTITGKVTLELEKETKIESLFVKLKGDVRVNWSEKYGDKSRNYSAHTRLFKQKQLLIRQESNDTKRPAGIHMFKFSLSIPQGNMPSSFRGTYGKVVYKLEAKLSRNWRMDSTDEKELCFRSKAFSNIDQMNLPQVRSTNKEVGVFRKGTVQMDVTVDKRGYVPGDSVLITAKVNNSSSKDATPKFSFIQDVLCRASGNTKHEKNVIHREIRERVKPQTSKELRFSFKIPSKTPLSIQNCNILSVVYRIKVYLDISFSFDPEVVLPVDLFWISPHSAGGAVGGPSASDFPAPVSFASPYSPAAGASLYPETAQHPHSPPVYSGAQPDAYGSPFSSSSSASVLYPPPPAGPAHSQFTSAPPSYDTLEPPPPSYSLAPLSSGVTVPSAPVMTENFLSRTDEEPPSYEILFPSSNVFLSSVFKMPSVKRLVLTYDELNEYGTFSEGDTITGKVTLELEKETKIKSLFVKVKGDVRVNWSEPDGDSPGGIYRAHMRLFKQKQFLIRQESSGTKLPAGIHIFKFSLSIPQRNMPSSFQGTYGKVVYKLEAKLSRSWRMDSTDEKELCFRSKAFPHIDQMNLPQVGSTNKEVGVFSKGTVQMDVTVDKRGYVPGDSVLITAKFNNYSSKDATPKFSFIQDVLYRASGNTKHHENEIHKETRVSVKPRTSKELRFFFKIPSKTPLSIQNCNILSVEYRIKVYLDISFSSNPEVVLPVDIFWISPHSAGGAVGGTSASDFPPQLPDAYGSPFSSSSSASVLYPPPPAAPPPPPGPAHSQFASAPPTYNTLEPPPPSYPLAPLSSGVTVPSAPMMTENFLSRTDEEAPSYEILFPSSNGSNSDQK
ncbi:uncharacterized protein LOC117376079 [Periophthalmus magnuspinnatus]|uniref:uncharacterized protein LOC117376079 n=1 Tax=Periophthalmus magnuspinnatus TaxID=409849 RepID=UPI00145A341B|nr:uncharacterized protein LOC117376079 [Periophthalmus magnuspinnatus]